MVSYWQISKTKKKKKEKEKGKKLLPNFLHGNIAIGRLNGNKVNITLLLGNSATDFIDRCDNIALLTKI